MREYILAYQIVLSSLLQLGNKLLTFNLSLQIKYYLQKTYQWPVSLESFATGNMVLATLGYTTKNMISLSKQHAITIPVYVIVI